MPSHTTSKRRCAAQVDATLSVRASGPALSAASSPALKPLVLALLAAFPLQSMAQVSVVRPVITAPPPGAAVVPRPMPGWRVAGTGAQTPINKPNTAGGTDQSINQNSLRAVYNWQSFDIGANSKVTFNFPSADASALNRVMGSTAPSQIFGSLRSQYTNPDPAKAPLVGGSIYLINANGILFGKGSQVNVGSLIASTLNLKDSDYFSGLNNSITDTVPSFTSGPELFTDDKSFVLLDSGAAITTPNGGRVFLFAKNVQNAGTITTPGGQTALAAGSEIYLNVPTAEPANTIYASEVNAALPALRGLLVEVGQGAGSVANLRGGVINTPRGNTTLVGMAVNQSGIIRATTSVSENGSVFLRARGETDGAAKSNVGAVLKRATVSGSLTLGAGSTIEVTPDTAPGSDGKLPTSDANTSFLPSVVQMVGKTVELQSGASITAHGGSVSARAEVTPLYDLKDKWAPFVTTNDARLTVADKVLIDVSGTTTTTASTARNFVTTELLGKADLKDAPLQKDGPLYRAKATFDVRSPVAILSDTSNYLLGIQRTAEEKLATGGAIALTSTGALATHASSLLNASGGRVSYTDANVVETRLISADGARYTLNTAPKDIVYTGIEGASKAPTIDRWGIVPQYVASQSQTGRLEKGYVDGQAGGSISLVAPISVMDGQLKAASEAGVRQTSGQSPLAAAGSVNLGFRKNDGDPNITDFTAGLKALDITKNKETLGNAFWDAPLTSDLAAINRIAAPTLQSSGAGKIIITTDGDFILRRGADLYLAPKSALDLQSSGASGIEIGANFGSEGGTFSAVSKDAKFTGRELSAGGVNLLAGQQINVAGAWVNRAQDGAQVLAATSGGKVTFSSARELVLEDASRIDVSGGATVGVAGTVAAIKGTDAGSITLEGNTAQTEVGRTAARMHIGADLKAQSLAGGGSLTLAGADRVVIGAQPIPRGIKDGLTVGALTLSEAWFRNGAFTSYDVRAAQSLTVQPGTLIVPQASNWLLAPQAAQIASGTRISTVLDQTQLPEVQRKPVDVSLSAVSPYSTSASGALLIADGARIVADPLASVNLAAGFSLDVQGQLKAPGGKVNLTLRKGAKDAPTDTPATGLFRVGEKAVIDVSGRAVLQTPAGPVAQGVVLAGGSVKLEIAGGSARLTPTEVLKGAVIAADGASERLAVAFTTAGGSTALREQTVSSEGGSISVQASNGGALLAGDMHAKATDARTAGGSFNLSLNGFETEAEGLARPRQISTIVVQQAAVAQTEPVAGTVQVSAQSLAAGFADVSLVSRDRIRFSGDVNLAVAKNLVLDAPEITASAQSKNVTASGASTLTLRSVAEAVDGAPLPSALPGNADLKLRGGLVEFTGRQALQGFKTVRAQADSEIRLNDGAKGYAGRLSLQADAVFDAPQVTVTSNSNFTVDAPGQKLLITGGNVTGATPLSAGGTINLNARDITTVNPTDAAQVGMLRAPFGVLNLNASESITVGAGSELSVSGQGSTVPFGTTIGGDKWNYNGAAVDAPVAKAINLSAPGKAVDVKAGATLNLSGGGDLLALEFVAGPGGSKDIFAGLAGGAFAVLASVKGYAPQDLDILLAKDAAQLTANSSLGRQVTFGAGGPLPAGTYTALPARYATLPGAYLVRPMSSGARFELGAAVRKADGSTWVGGQLGDKGTASASLLPQTFQVLSSDLARSFSEIKQTQADNYFTAKAQAAGTAAPRLPVDAGRLNVVADQLNLKGSTAFGLPADARARGGELDVSAANIRITSNASVADTAGVLSLNPADLNSTGAALIVVGGLRADAGGTAGGGGEVSVSANSIVVDNAGAPLTVADLVLVAKERVELKPGARIEAVAGKGSAGVLNVSGDGALLRVSIDTQASSVRSNTVRAAGDLLLGAGVSLKGGAVTAEATRSALLASDATIAAHAVTLGASRIAAGQLDAATTQRLTEANTLVLGDALTRQLSQAQALTLRSFDGLDLYGAVNVGAASLRSLTVDTGSLNLMAKNNDETAGTRARLTAGDVQLVNTSGASSLTASGKGDLQIEATGLAGGAGQVVIGPGSVAVAAAQTVSLVAQREWVLKGKTDFSTAGDMSVKATALQAGAATFANVNTVGGFKLDRTAAPAGEPPVAAVPAALGAHVVINAASIAQLGNIVLPSGQVSLMAKQASSTATTPITTDSVVFGAGSVTDVSGRSKTFDGVTVTTGGGDVTVAAASGNVTIETNARIDASSRGEASASSVSGRAGSITIAAPLGTVNVKGDLRAVSLQQSGGALSIDSQSPINLAALARTIGAEAGNFGDAISVRNRIGDQRLEAGTALTAKRISLSSDEGSLSVAGKLEASSASGPRVVLAAGNTLSVEQGAELLARSNSSVGGEVQLMAGRALLQEDGSFARNGQVLLNGGRIDTSAAAVSNAMAAEPPSDGRLLIRAQRDALDADVRVSRTSNATPESTTKTNLIGVSQVELEAVKQYDATVVDSALINRINTDNLAFAGDDGSQAAAMSQRVQGLFTNSTNTPVKLQLRSGVEVISSGDLTVRGSTANNGWNLTRFNADGSPASQASGAPMNLSLRAAGNLNVLASISDGFTPAGNAAPTSAAAASRIVPAAVIAKISGEFAEGARMRMVGGADASAANVMTTKASADDGGDVLVGGANRDVLVRSTTGDIQMAAGRDVKLLDHRAAVYTTGRPVNERPGYVGDLLATAAYLFDSGSKQSPFLRGGGSVDIAAKRDVVGAGEQGLGQFGTEWLWRARDQGVNLGEPIWWTRYDKFKQGFASLGGGNVTATAQRNVSNVEVSSSVSGFVARDDAGKSLAAKQVGGGDVSVRAKADVVGGFAMAGAGDLTVTSGGSISAAADAAALQVVYGNSRITLAALNDLDIGYVSSFGLVPATRQTGLLRLPVYASGLSAKASLSALASSGNVAYRSASALSVVQVNPALATAEAHLSNTIIAPLPDRVLFAAPNGDVTLGSLAQAPQGTTAFSALAGKNLSVAKITITGTDVRSGSPTWLGAGAGSTQDYAVLSRSGDQALDLGERTPTRLVASEGDIRLSDVVETTTSVRLTAGRDANFVEAGRVLTQHQNPDELSVVLAGRDVLLPASGTRSSDLRLHGPGDLLVMAGRDIDLKTSGGIATVGNRENPGLASQSGTLTVLPGVALPQLSLGSSNDYTQAAAWYFPLLGGTGISAFAPDLAAQLSAFRSGAPLPALGSAAASAFKALTPSEQINQAKSLSGAAVFDAALLTAVQLKNTRLEKPEAVIDLARAQTVYAAWSVEDQRAVVNAALANAWSASLPKAQQATQVLAMTSSAQLAANETRLVNFVQTTTGTDKLSTEQALLAFNALPPERQLLLTNQVLAAEVRKAGRDAQTLSGAQRDAAYARAYNAIDTVFPEAGITGNLKMGSSQLRTLQDSSIRVLAPRGSVDVGALVADSNPKAATLLGIVTAAGGDVSLIVRDSVNVNQSRVFTVGKGDLLMWASFGNLDAGRGAKTVLGAPPPLFRLDDQGNFVIDTSGSFSGSGIAVLDAGSTLDLYAPKGEINAGDAGIKSLGNAFLGAARFVGADNLAVGGVAVGAPPPASTGGETASVAAAGQAASTTATRVNAEDSEEEKERKRRKRLNLILDFLGFGDPNNKP
jgi:filamentous hemagglutinin family protein